MKAIKDFFWIIKEWGKRMYIYPQNQLIPGAHFDYDAYWKEKRGGKYMGSLGGWQMRRAKLATKILLENSAESLNDIGSGSGEVLDYIINSAHLSKAVAYDNSEYALQIVRERGLVGKRIDIIDRNTYSQIDTADYTILFEILEHIPGPEELLQEVFKKSNKGVMFSFPNTAFLVHRFRLFFFGKFPLQWAKHPGEHLRFWTKKDLVWWLNAQGYRNYKIQYYVGVPLLKNIWPNLFCAGFFVTIFK